MGGGINEGRMYLFVCYSRVDYDVIRGTGVRTRLLTILHGNEGINELSRLLIDRLLLLFWSILSRDCDV